MKLIVRKTNQNDLDNIYDMHIKCFIPSEHWYKTIIRQYLNDSILIEIKETNQVIGVLLHGEITVCEKSEI
jgi:hypothetical protein